MPTTLYRLQLHWDFSSKPSVRKVLQLGWRDGEHEEVALSSSISLLWVRHAVAVRQHLIAPDG